MATKTITISSTFHVSMSITVRLGKDADGSGCWLSPEELAQAYTDIVENGEVL